MRHLLRLFVVLALVFGSACAGRAQNFHVKVLDPANFCIDNPSACFILDSTSPFTATFSSSTCMLAGVPGLPSNPSTYGCLALFNLTANPITTLDLSFSGLGPLTYQCDTTGPGVLFSSAICGPSGSADNFYFYNGALDTCTLENCPVAIIYEDGVDPDLFDGTGTVNTPAPVPEPAPLVLLLTGTLLTGAFFFKRETLFAAAHK